MTEVCVLRAKTYAFLLDDFTDNDYSMRGIINKKANDTKKSIIKNRITFNDYVDVLFRDKNIKRSQFTFRSDHHNVYTEKINKKALSSNMIKEYNQMIKLLPTLTVILIMMK